jgi:FtsP/CotA-like multicopper oxidase with cupredoxin domain
MHWFLARSTASRAVLGLSLVCLALGLAQAIGGCTDDGDNANNGGNGSNNGFPQPVVRQSSGGVLHTTLRAHIATNTITDAATGQTGRITGPTYEGTVPGPTLVVNPGDTLSIDLVNDLPANPPAHHGGAFPHDPYTTNLHTHGLSVSPLGNSDNVLREMPPGGTHNPVLVRIPDTHAAGTFWYHPHKHGSTTFQFLGGMAGLLLIKGGAGTLDTVPEVQAARDVVMLFQILRTDANGQVVFVNPEATQFGSNFGETDGLWSPYLGTATGGSQPTTPVYYTTNGVVNPTLHMRPGEVQRWRLLNASAGENLLVALQGHSLHVIANDGLTVPSMLTLAPGTPYTMGAGQRADVLVQAAAPGTYLLQSLALSTPASVSPQGVAPAPRITLVSADFPTPNNAAAVTLATIVVEGTPAHMSLPGGALPPPAGLPSMETMLGTTPNAVRNIFFDLCGMRANMQPSGNRLPSCAPYFARYDETYWGGQSFTSLLLFRDGDDVTFVKEGLFNGAVPLFDNMIAGNFEKWTVTNRSFSDHPFHIHQNPFLVTRINGIPLPVPEWHDTINVLAAVGGTNINLPCTAPDDPPGCVTYGSIEFYIHYDPLTVGSFVMHCHVLQHEDIGMMQRVDILPAP